MNALATCRARAAKSTEPCEIGGETGGEEVWNGVAVFEIAPAVFENHVAGDRKTGAHTVHGRFVFENKTAVFENGAAVFGNISAVFENDATVFENSATVFENGEAVLTEFAGKREEIRENLQRRDFGPFGQESVLNGRRMSRPRAQARVAPPERLFAKSTPTAANICPLSAKMRWKPVPMSEQPTSRTREP